MKNRSEGDTEIRAFSSSPSERKLSPVSFPKREKFARGMPQTAVATRKTSTRTRVFLNNILKIDVLQCLATVVKLSVYAPDMVL